MPSFSVAAFLRQSNNSAGLMRDEVVAKRQEPFSRSHKVPKCANTSRRGDFFSKAVRPRGFSV
jgi:hypothetical protein